MQIFLNPLVLALFLLLLVLHPLSGILPARLEKTVKYTNVCLHIVLFFVLMLKKIPLDEVALLYLVSLLFYLISYLLWERVHRLKGNAERKGGKEIR